MNKEEFMEAAWGSFISWAIKSPDMLKEYEHMTGKTLSNPKSPIEAMIDEATVHGKDSVMDFLIWVTDAHWGMQDAPVKFREEVSRLRGTA